MYRRKVRESPPEELQEFSAWCMAHGVEPPRQRPITHQFRERPWSARDEAQARIASNKRNWEYPKWLAAPQDWANAHGGDWPVVSELGPGIPDRPDRPALPQQGSTPCGEGVLPHPGRWCADDHGNISCLEHGRRSDRH